MPKGVYKRAIDRSGFIGQKFNRLTILSFVNNSRILCKCECGNEITTSFLGVTRDNRPIKSCGCARFNENINFEAEHGRWVKHNIRTRNIENSITLEQFSILIVQNCHYCGQEPNQVLKYSSKFCKNGIDRKDNNIGYHYDNCVTACGDCNMCKQKFSYDRFFKLVFKDDDVLEVSYIRKNDGKDIICVPTQTSCRMGCKFCHLTGNGIEAKNINSDRILSLIIASLKFQKPSNNTLLISYMNSGEPLMNVDGLIRSAVDLRTSSKYKFIQDSYKTIRYGVSTILPGYKRFEQFKKAVIDNKLPVKLHWSLHSLDAIERKSLMPGASPIAQSLSMVNEYVDETGQPAEIHYTLMHEINDRQIDLDRFAKLSGRKATIKLLKFAEKESEPTLLGSKRTDWFRIELERQGYNVEVYSPPGKDIGSSCGQFILDQYTK